MKHSFPCLILLFIFICKNTHAQSGNYLYYFDKDLNITSKQASVFTGIGKPDGGLIDLQVFNNKNKKLVLDAHFTDSTLNFNEGLFRTFYSNGYKETEGIYMNNLHEGSWIKWDTLGYMIDSTIYLKGKKALVNSFTYYNNGILRDQVMDDLEHDLLQKKLYNEKGLLIGEDLFHGNTGITKSYQDGLVKIDTVYSREQTEAIFPGGNNAWKQYMRKIMDKNIDALTNDNKSGTCILNFMIDTLGNVSNVEAITMKESVLARIFVKAIQDGPKWTPAKQYGRLVKAFRMQPITFMIDSK